MSYVDRGAEPLCEEERVHKVESQRLLEEAGKRIAEAGELSRSGDLRSLVLLTEAVRLAGAALKETERAVEARRRATTTAL